MNVRSATILIITSFHLYRPTVLCKIVGVYQIGYHNRETGKRTMEQVAVMQVGLVVAIFLLFSMSPAYGLLSMYELDFRISFVGERLPRRSISKGH